MSLAWLVNPFGRSDPPNLRFLLKFPAANNNNSVPSPNSIRSRWGQYAPQAQPQILQRTAGWDGCGLFLSEGLRCIKWNTGGLAGSVCSKEQRVQTQLSQITSGPQQYQLSPKITWKKRVFFKLSRWWLHDFGSFVNFFHKWCCKMAICIHRDYLAWRSSCVTCNYLWRPWSLCEHSIWTTTLLLSTFISNLNLPWGNYVAD